MPHPIRIALLTLSLAAFGCNQLKAVAGGNKKKEKPPAAAEAPATPSPAAAVAAAEPAKAAVEPAEPARYGVPFAWESSPNEPLAKARGFLAEALRANQLAVGLGRQHYAPFVEGQSPRATVVTCADSRVQPSAWDQTPENDDFTVRNIGNQVSNALGSVEYGVEELHTPLLLVVGHTGCGAVKAAMGKPDELSPAIRSELAALKLPPARKGVKPEAAWTDAVSANVNTQVQLATEHFAELVHSGELTVVGAVYDFRNDLGKGYGRLQVINVNTNTDPTRIDAFLKAVQGMVGAAGAAGASGAASLSASPGVNASPTGSVTLNGKPVGSNETVEDRVKKIIDRAQRALPSGKKPNVTVSASETEHSD